MKCYRLQQMINDNQELSDYCLGQCSTPIGLTGSSLYCTLSKVPNMRCDYLHNMRGYVNVCVYMPKRIRQDFDPEQNMGDESLR